MYRFVNLIQLQNSETSTHTVTVLFSFGLGPVMEPKISNTSERRQPPCNQPWHRRLRQSTLERLAAAGQRITSLHLAYSLLAESSSVHSPPIPLNLYKDHHDNHPRVHSNISLKT